MSKTIKIDLTKNDLQKFITKFKVWKEEDKSVNKSIINDLKEIGVNQISKTLGTNVYEPNEPTNLVNETIGENKAKIGIKGRQALYDEFGTGTRGAEGTHHPLKSEMGMNPYNYHIKPTGTIRWNGNSADSKASQQGIPPNTYYWTYKYNGEKIYTYGRPAGLHVYTASKTIKNKMKQITKKRITEWLSKL